MPGGSEANANADQVFSEQAPCHTPSRSKNCSECTRSWYLFIYVNHVEQRIYLFDPFGRGPAEVVSRRAITVTVYLWLRAQRQRLNRPARPDYVTFYNTVDLT